MQSVGDILKNCRYVHCVSELHVTRVRGLYWPTCLLCCLVLRRTICRMLELVMSDTTSDTRFHTRNRAPHNMWYWRRRMPCRHSWPSSIFLHFPFLRKGQKRKSQIFNAYNKSSHRFLANHSFRRTVWHFWQTAQRFLHPSKHSSLVIWWRAHMWDLQFISSWLVLRWSANPWEWHLTLKPPWLHLNKYQPDWIHWAINPKGHCGFLFTSWHGYTSWRRRWTGSPSCPWLPLESPRKENVQQQNQQKTHHIHGLMPHHYTALKIHQHRNFCNKNASLTSDQESYLVKKQDDYCVQWVYGKRLLIWLMWFM